MKHAILSGARQAFGVRLLLAILAMAAVLFFASADKLLQLFPVTLLKPSGYHTQLVLSALRSDTAIPFVPIVAVLPFAGSFVDDVKSKFARFFCIRSGWGVYLYSRAAVCFLSGGLAVVGGGLLAWGLAALVLLPLEEAGPLQQETLTLLGETLLLYFLSGGLWAVAGMAMSTLMESRYIAYASPFVAYYLLVILHERYAPKIFVLDPAQWIYPTERWPFGIAGPAVLMLELTLALAALFIIRAERRLRTL